MNGSRQRRRFPIERYAYMKLPVRNHVLLQEYGPVWGLAGLVIAETNYWPARFSRSSFSFPFLGEDKCLHLRGFTRFARRCKMDWNLRCFTCASRGQTRRPKAIMITMVLLSLQSILQPVCPSEQQCSQTARWPQNTCSVSQASNI